jgi:hypothetical protein
MRESKPRARCQPPREETLALTVGVILRTTIRLGAAAYAEPLQFPSRRAQVHKGPRSSEPRERERSPRRWPAARTLGQIDADLHRPRELLMRLARPRCAPIFCNSRIASALSSRSAANGAALTTACALRNVSPSVVGAANTLGKLAPH